MLNIRKGSGQTIISKKMWDNLRADLRNLFKRRNTYSEEDFVDVVMSILYEDFVAVLGEHVKKDNRCQHGGSCDIYRSLAPKPNR